MRLNNIILPSEEGATEISRWDIEVDEGIIRQILPSEQGADAPSKLLLPALCHPHIHLDKPFILTCNHVASASHPDYSDLVPKTGSFAEALLNTSRAKERYTQEDLYLRGSQLLAASYEQGVTSLRAFVEVDHVTGILPLTTAVHLREDFSHLVEVQICAFAQDPIFSTSHGEANRSIITSALSNFASSIHVLGTTPYVEESREASLKNIEWAITTAIRHHLHLDFHLDYNLNPPSRSEPLIISMIELLKRHDWVALADRSRTIVLGHCTQLSILGDSDLQQLAQSIVSSKLPIHFVGLPTSDLFMMGRLTETIKATHVRPRGTLQVPSMIKDLGLSACIGVNNVGNAFTPFGTGDPLQIASWGVGIYQAGTTGDARLLYGCVSWLARKAIGLDAECNNVAEGRSLLGMLLVENRPMIQLPGRSDECTLEIPARKRLGFRDVVWDPPDVALRSVVK
ncbi:Metallo-dependent hydrolase [Xylariaceae sp. FL0662B]|nr:Metallo-dependent hydrolase [Xylariaceae sp. FL0662B]